MEKPTFIKTIKNAKQDAVRMYKGVYLSTGNLPELAKLVCDIENSILQPKEYTFKSMVSLQNGMIGVVTPRVEDLHSRALSLVLITQELTKEDYLALSVPIRGAINDVRTGMIIGAFNIPRLFIDYFK